MLRCTGLCRDRSTLPWPVCLTSGTAPRRSGPFLRSAQDGTEFCVSISYQARQDPPATLPRHRGHSSQFKHAQPSSSPTLSLGDPAAQTTIYAQDSRSSMFLAARGVQQKYPDVSTQVHLALRSPSLVAPRYFRAVHTLDQKAFNSLRAPSVPRTAGLADSDVV